MRSIKLQSVTEIVYSASVSQQPIKPRNHLIDGLRGFALISIMIVHASNHFMYASQNSTNILAFDLWDEIGSYLVYILFIGKSSSLFALLFGVTYAIQLRNQEKKGLDFAGRFAWRLSLLMGFACFNAIFFPSGDILMTYAIVAFALIPVRHFSVKTLIVISGLLFLQPQQWFYEAMKVISPDWQSPEWGWVREFSISFRGAQKEGTAAGILWANVTEGQVVSILRLWLTGRSLQILGFFILGFALQKSNMFDITDSRVARIWKKILLLTVPITLCLFLYEFFPIWETTKIVNLVLSRWCALSMSMMYCALFYMVYRRSMATGFCRPFEQYAQMSLSNYIGQSIFGMCLFAPFALNLGAHLGSMLSMVMAVFIVVVQIKLSQLWLQNHRYGPCEGLWHRLTWLKKARKS